MKKFQGEKKHQQVVEHQNTAANHKTKQKQSFSHLKLMILVLYYLWEEVRV